MLVLIVFCHISLAKSSQKSKSNRWKAFIEPQKNQTLFVNDNIIFHLSQLILTYLGKKNQKETHKIFGSKRLELEGHVRIQLNSFNSPIRRGAKGSHAGINRLKQDSFKLHIITHMISKFGNQTCFYIYRSKLFFSIFPIKMYQ